ncbi:carbon-nitrogen hydrolase family protein [Alkalihalobacillus sp. AL-G]|uniref:carbon-nitrogen hydrolase family protein n=1 Tax=Alkalihalobacillus sp. AL-G TaxID=2926399 RepID=UPI002729E5C4|nr:carbon-nitrogen hydrolase family protein [Alkalihalobacillus sp. AL-G]WLD93907.1 carbon-nitrogen hydrolase family protein [Alkalihalobacillus sp. AL-G]
MKLNVHVGQFAMNFDIEHNLNHILNMINQVEVEELLILPEGALSGYSDDLSFLKSIDQIELVEAIETIVQKVKERRIHLVFGSCLFKDEKWYNAGIYVSPEGKLSIHYKVNLATHEREVFTAGNHLTVFEMQVQQNVIKFGIQLCREIRFPEQWKFLSLQGAQFIAYLTNVTSTENAYVWKSHLVSRAAENQRFVLVSNVAHEQQGCPTMIVSPKGEVLIEVLSESVELKKTTIDLTETSDWYLDQSRTDVVKVGI